MAYQANFKRYEIKYMLTLEQKQQLVGAMEPYMRLDNYGRTTIRNLYYDTDSYRLIRQSIERPTYKEKLRVRSYAKVEPGAQVFVELKKKFKSVVYKRRVSMPEQNAMSWLERDEAAATAEMEERVASGITDADDKNRTESYQDTQIKREINYFLDYYKDLHPTVFLSYEREAYYALDGSDFRVTFDDNILVRQDRLSLTEDVGGEPILDKGYVLMEIKCSGGIPLWMTHLLTEHRIYKTRFSKYGTAYKNIIYKGLKEAK